MPRAKKKPIEPAHNTGTPQAPKAPPGMPYGQNQAAVQAQRAVPLAGGTPTAPPAGPTPPAGGPPPEQGAPQAPPDNNAMLQAAQGFDFQPVGLTGPTANPGEPVTSGLPFGPGAGPEALGIPDPTQEDVQAWRPYLPALEYLASQPNSTASTRNFTRRLRAIIPSTPIQQQQ